MDALVELINVDYQMGSRLAALGIESPTDLLARTRCTADQHALATQLGVATLRVQRWSERAALMQVPGLGALYVHLLNEAGVTTLARLAQADAAALFDRMTQVNRQRKIVRRLPTAAHLQAWIGAARQLATQPQG